MKFMLTLATQLLVMTMYSPYAWCNVQTTPSPILDNSNDANLPNESRDAECNGCRRAGRFRISYTAHHGYELVSLDGLNSRIAIDADEDILQDFDRFFLGDNLSRYLGKTINCDCVGEWHTRDGMTRLRIIEAVVFAR
jgi:hypothetical protein